MTQLPIKGYSGYFATTEGLIISRKRETERVLKGGLNRYGYLSVAQETEPRKRGSYSIGSAPAWEAVMSERNRKPCSGCPFLKSSPLIGSPEWLEDVLKLHTKNEYFSHTCHKTDPKADGYIGTKKKTECMGHLNVVMNSFGNTPGLGGVYESIEQLAKTYFKSWGIEIDPRATLRLERK